MQRSRFCARDSASGPAESLARARAIDSDNCGESATEIHVAQLALLPRPLKAELSLLALFPPGRNLIWPKTRARVVALARKADVGGIKSSLHSRIINHAISGRWKIFSGHGAGKEKERERERAVGLSVGVTGRDLCGIRMNSLDLAEKHRSCP